MMPILKYLRTIITSCLIFYVSIIRIPPVKAVEWIPYFDKMVHFGMYFILATCIFLDFLRTPTTNQTKRTVLGIIVPSLYGGLIEILQGAYFPPRSADWFDFFADCLGALASYFICIKILSIKVQRNSI